MEFDYYSPSETFVALTADQFVGRDDGLLEQQKQDSHVCRRNDTFPLILRKNQSPQINNDKNAPCVKQVNSVSSLNMVEFQSMYWERETVFFSVVSCQLYNTPKNHLHICSLGVQHVLHHPELYIESN